MKLMIIRHGDPDYEHDSLTPKGWKEAGLLADRLSKISVRAFYCSPLGRARDTASVTLKRMAREATVCNWLQEFPASIVRPDSGKQGIAWDLLPGFWTKRRILYDKDGWYHDPVMETGNVQELYRAVTDGLDAVLSRHGYERSGMCYQVSAENRDTLVFFCHLGVGCTMLGHLLGIPAPVLWHGIFLAPASVTTLVTEEREKGTASFRCTGLGDTSHLSFGGEPVSNSGLFPETFQTSQE